MKQNLAWQPVTDPDIEDVHRFLTDVDLAFGNVIERTLSDVNDLLKQGMAWEVRAPAGRLCGVALAVPGEECLLRVDASQLSRTVLLRQGVSVLDDALMAGTPLWLPTRDSDAKAMATEQQLVSPYTDLQMRIQTTAAATTPPPRGTHLRDFEPSVTALREVHDLVCAAWGVDDHWSAFLRRFEPVARERSFWVLLEGTGGELLAACIGDVQVLGDGRFGIVRHLDVAPDARRRGLGSWAVNELVARFARAGLAEAQLGVHDNNKSAAPALYTSLGWRLVSSQDMWVHRSDKPAERPASQSPRRTPVAHQGGG